MKKKAISGAVIAFLVSYLIICFFQVERGRYNQLDALAKRSSGLLADLSAQFQQIGAESSDKDLKFMAEYFGTTCTALSNCGYNDWAEVKAAGHFGAALTGFVNGLLQPINSLKGIGLTAWLIWNRGDAEKAAASLDNRYGGANLTAIILSGLVAFVVYKFCSRSVLAKPYIEVITTRKPPLISDVR